MDHEQGSIATDHSLKVIDIFVGPIFTYLTDVSDKVDAFCVMRVAIPDGVTVPVHSHADRETFYILAGALQVLVDSHWQTLQAGDVIDVDDGIRHALRNLSGAGVSLLLVTTMRMGQFFRDVGRPATGVPLAPPMPADLQHFAEISTKYGYWLGGPEDNASVGIVL